MIFFVNIWCDARNIETVAWKNRAKKTSSVRTESNQNRIKSDRMWRSNDGKESCKNNIVMNEMML